MRSILSIVRPHGVPPSESRLRLLYSVVAMIAVVAIIVSLATGLRHSLIHSDDCLWMVKVERSTPYLYVSHVPDEESTDQSKLMVGDRVLAINNGKLPTVSLAQAPFLADSAQKLLDEAPTGVRIPYLVERNGRAVELQIELTSQFLFLPLLPPTLAFLWLLIGFTVAMTRPRGSLQRRFFFAAALVIFAFGNPPSSLFSSHPSGNLIGVLVAVAWGICGAFFYPLWLHFCTTFPINQKIFATPARKALLYGPLVLIIVEPLLILLSMITELRLEALWHPIIYYGTLIGSGIYFGGGVWFLYRGYQRMPVATDRRPVTAILIGSILASVALVYFMVLETTSTVAGMAIFNPQYLLPVFLLLALPISFGYAIFKYQVLDFGRVVRATAVYMASMALVAGLYLAVGYAVGQAFGALSGESVKGTIEVITFVLFLLLFESVKRQVQQAIENRFFPQRRDYSGRLATFASEIAETVGAQGVAERTARTLCDALQLHGVCVVVEDPHDGELRPLARVSDFPLVPVDENAIESLRGLLRQSHTFLSLETIADPTLATLQQFFPYAIGMYAQKKVIGVILLSRPRSGEGISGSQTPFIAGVAAHGAAALEVARLYQEEIARQRYREELATARRIQESLLPTQMPDIPGISISAVSRPAQAVGGDYYDIIHLDKSRFLVIAADVSGKGLPASLYMAEFHGMVHVACGMHNSPKEILTILNEHLFEVIARGSFISATMLLFDTTRQSVSFARAGHTPIIRRNGRDVDTLIPTGVALGLCSRELFSELLQEYTVEYEPGETFILYSDGVSEAMNERREEFGEGRLHDVIRGAANPTADALRDRILTDIEKFRGTAEQNDDITLVVVRIEKEVHSSLLPPVPARTSTA